jgi:hypothetical protein
VTYLKEIIRRQNLTYGYIFLSIGLLILPRVVLSQPAVPIGRPITVMELITIAQSLGGFLMVAGGIIAGIVIVWVGIMYLMAGSDSAKVKSAKDMFRAGIIGALIIFGAGLIINTVRTFASDPLQFFR